MTSATAAATITDPDSPDLTYVVKPQCFSCKRTPGSFILTCMGCLQYHSRERHFCLYCADKYQLITAHQYINGADHLFHRTVLGGTARYKCNNCATRVDKDDVSFTCPSCPYQGGFDQCLSCAFGEREVRATHNPKHNELVQVFRGVVSLRSLVEVHTHSANADQDTQCNGCQRQIIGPIFGCRSGSGEQCDYVLCAECIHSGKGRLRDATGTHGFQIEYGDLSRRSSFRRRATQSKSLVPLIPRQRLSSKPQDVLVSELQARYSKLRLSRNNSVVGIFASVGFSVVTHGTSLFGLLFSGPKFVYYEWKIVKLKKLMKKEGIDLPDRRVIEFVAPLVLGAVVGGIGLGVDGVAALGDAAVNHAPDASTHVVSAAKFITGIGSGAVDAVQELGTAAVSPPSDVFTSAVINTSHVFNPDPLVNSGSEAIADHLQHGSDRLHHLADSITHGTVWTEHYGHDLGKGVAAAYLGEKISKGLAWATRDVTEPSGSRREDRGNGTAPVPVEISQLLQDSAAFQRRPRPRPSSNPRLQPPDLTIPPVTPQRGNSPRTSEGNAPNRSNNRSPSPVFPDAPYDLIMRDM
ncbi:hypothetical protein FRB90_005862 [Tulasnella sp. 427]|nr:hypothetical protein FRB90_005862 [Tulasnella sp. 427]